MLFNSFQFLVFFAVVYAAYLVLNHRQQNLLLLLASYVFYASWDWRFLSLIWVSTAVDFFAGKRIYEAEDKSTKRLYLLLSVGTNLGLLGCFKYLDFFIESFAAFTAAIGLPLEVRLISIVLPVGISFYTFQTMSYTIDIYRGQLKPTRSILDFALFVAFFPQLVAGPIERAANLLPQLQSERKISYDDIKQGAWLVLRGYYKKVVLADNLAPFVDEVFARPEGTRGPLVLIGIYAFALQIYGDFSGYTDIARGIARLLGVRLRLNFRMPYFATNPRDFWSRWHISLSTWLRDYLYIPLGGNRGGTLLTYRNLLITMVLGGLWHGAAWHFVAWGVFHGLILILHRALFTAGFNWVPDTRSWRLFSMVAFFHVTCLGWLLFRVEDLSHVPILVTNLFLPGGGWLIPLATIVVFYGPLLLIEIFDEAGGTDMRLLASPLWWRRVVYTAAMTAIFFSGVMDKKEFIYFQF